MKKNFTLLLFFAAISVVAQAPAGYYNTATGTGYLLKSQLYNIIKDHFDPGYSGLYTTYLTSDRDWYYENNGTVLDMYTEKPTGTECEYTYGINQDDGTGGNSECQKYNREHLIPQSVYASLVPMYSDAHCVVPADKFVNAQRGDLPFGRVATANWTSTNGSKRGSNLNSGYSAGYTGTVFEPIDEFKGDIARMFFYFATRYEDQVAGWPYTMFNGTWNQVFTSNAINVLLTWANQDPVSQREIDRNNAIYARQNNRNPFIDNPQYAMSIWGSLLDNAAFEQVFGVSVYPNPTQGAYSIRCARPLQRVEIYSISGQLIQQDLQPAMQQNIYQANQLLPGFYLIKLTADGKSGTVKLVVR
jgi:endonuclease I